MAHAIGRVAIVGLGLIGSSVARAIKAKLPDVAVTGHDADPDVRAEARALGFCDAVSDDAAVAVEGADLVILAVPVGRMAAAAWLRQRRPLRCRNRPGGVGRRRREPPRG